MRAIFLDKDGTLVKDVPYNADPELIELSSHAGAALRMLRDQGYALIVISNQSGIARGMFPESALQKVRDKIDLLLAEEGASIDDFFYCPHHPQGVVEEYAFDCGCRKPLPGMLEQAAFKHGIDLSNSWMIGDILDDIEAGHRAGCRALLISNGNETEWQFSAQRMPDLIAPDLYRAAQAIRIADQISFYSPLACKHGVTC